MNYTYIYSQLIKHRQMNQLGRGMSEIHHIKPKSWGGTDEAENLIRLSFREHFVAHKLLVKIADTAKSKLQMIFALNRMAPGQTSSRQCELIKIKWSDANRNYMAEVLPTGETRRQYVTRKSARTMANNSINGKTLNEIRVAKISVHSTDVHDWVSKDGRVFTGTALELARTRRDERIEPSKIMRNFGTPEYHRGWRSLSGSKAKNHLEQKYQDVYEWLNSNGQVFIGNCYQLALTSKELFPGKLKRVAELGKSFNGWKAIKSVLAS